MDVLETHDRLWAKVDASGDCWEWTASRNNRGYGTYRDSGVTSMAHRFVYQALVGSIPDGCVLDHVCKNKACVNPDHLEPVSYSENNLRGQVYKYNHNLAKTRCKRGHPLSGDNVEVTPTSSGGSRRHCLACRKER